MNIHIIIPAHACLWVVWMRLQKALQSTQISSQALEAQGGVLARLGYKKQAQEMTRRFHQDTMDKPVMRTQLFHSIQITMIAQAAHR